ncbi:polyketide synthase dehydratase domain-containing protein [Roseibium salinum]|nr:polyketide synthase dehydratase domain-containing protein [Roseibium salinum]
MLARIELPDDLLKSQDDFQLHPSLLDGALQAAIGLVPKDDGSGQTALPFSIDTVEVSGPCKAQMWAHVRQQTSGSASQRKMDIDLVADNGSVRVALSGFATRLLARSGNQDILRFKPVWKPLPTAPAVEDGRRKIVLVVSPEIDLQKN